jgi:ribonuclease inhibitor
MEKIILDGKEMYSIKNTHKYLKEKLEFPSYYGENLDALWDMLSAISNPVSIELINVSYLSEKLELYASQLVETFCDVSKENDNVIFLIRE